MKIPIDKLLAISDNKYLFTKAAMCVIDKIGNINFKEGADDEEAKIVTRILNIMLDKTVKYQYIEDEDVTS